MAFDVTAAPRPEARLMPVPQRHATTFCFAVLTAACALASFAFACATPFAAFAVVAAAMLPLRSALPCVLGAWLVNQGIGFGALHYPVDANTLAWGAAIGAAALVATLGARLVLQALCAVPAPIALAAALLGAYAAYELVLLAVTPVLGGAASFTPAIVARLGLTSAAWLAGLAATCEIVRLLTPLASRRAMS
ncbi:hypothetical protein SSBR45G_43420 [Bradyrhizobium sp. SSBR45G]|uniref:hypothetical protein n=1 Tax=unclassified Bradyrhizobium TaxID=2631580 RepID=UPI0023429E8A|nr:MULTISPECIES: hypothetical protein [unclassified Bradyrhizobium]GLH79433.1 hypothetical protein SSBR45G_43420 [Bradyrhizobium sp. SSBR45G]GLH86810.1 hypothetical protein SSBR45R_42700 [Bradyrhizobium sp. SSBR45R]